MLLILQFSDPSAGLTADPDVFWGGGAQVGDDQFTPPSFDEVAA